METCTPSTRLYGLIGYPVSGSLSPTIHCILYHRYNIDAVYLAWNTPREKLSERIEALRSLAKGFNVTIPLKEAIISLLDGLSSDSEAVGAVNTVVVHGDSLIGYNTDYKAVQACLAGYKPEKALILGAGGAAKAALYALHLLGAREAVIANRSRNRGEKTARWARRLGLDAKFINLREAWREARGADIVVNATPIGSSACCPGEAPPVVQGLHEGQIVMDMAYNPPKTLLLEKAEEKKAVTINGLCMLIWQALYAEEIWLGIEVGAKDYEYIESLLFSPITPRARHTLSNSLSESCPGAAGSPRET